MNFFKDFFSEVKDYKRSGCEYIVPMTAHEVPEGRESDIFKSEDYFVEEKFDGTRAIMQFFEETNRPKDIPNSFVENFIFTLRDYYPEFFNKLLDVCKEPFDLDSVAINFDLVKTFKDLFKGHTFFNEEFGYIFKGDLSLNFILEETEDLKTVGWGQVYLTVISLISVGALYKQEAFTRVFSRKVSTKTDWFVENSDLLPQLRDINISALAGTILDGELLIPNKPFSEATSIMLCLPEKAIERQKERGKIVFHAFDILSYKGINLKNVPLYKRKEYLRLVISVLAECGYNDVQMVESFDKQKNVLLSEETYSPLCRGNLKPYPELKKAFDILEENNDNVLHLNKQAYYEYLVFQGKEGVILKNKLGKYEHKRSKSYLKVKKFLTRELLLIDFTPPTKEYIGKFPKDFWEYWLKPDGKLFKVEKSEVANNPLTSAKKLINKDGWIPVTRHYFYNQIGNLLLGVIITPEEVEKLTSKKKHDVRYIESPDGNDKQVLIVCECSGISDTDREYFTQISNSQEFIEGDTVIEVKANELFKDTGKMRHPRFLRIREDKDPLECTWSNHLV